MNHLRSPEFRRQVEARAGQDLRGRVEIFPIRFEGGQFYSDGLSALGGPDAGFHSVKIENVRGDFRLPSLWQLIVGEHKGFVDNVEVQRFDADFDDLRTEMIVPPKEKHKHSDSMSVSTSGLTKFTDRLLELFADALVNPVFPADELVKKQRRALSGIAASKKQPASLASNLMGKVIFGEHPYGSFPTEESVKAATRDAIVDFHKTWMVPNNSSLVIVGDVEPDAIVAKVEKAFAAWKKKDFPMIKQAAPPANVSGVTVHLVDRPESVQSNIIVCQTAPGRNFRTCRN